MEQITVDQHYVPRFYMENFSEVKGEGRKKKVLISFFQFDGDFYKDSVPVKSVCYQDYFYGKDGIIEKKLSEKESLWATTIKEILEKPEKPLDIDFVQILKEFGIYQYNRTLAIYNHSKAAMAEMIIKVESNNNSGCNRELIQESVVNEVNEQIQPSQIVELSDGLLEEMGDLSVSIVKFITVNELITSDMPVILVNPFNKKTTGLAHVGIVMMYPINHNTMVIIYDHKLYKTLQPYMVIDNEDDVINLNNYQLLSAEERIMSEDINNLVKALSESNSLLKRTEFHNTNKVNTSFDGIGTFVAMKQRSMKYLFPISLFNLQRQIKKIPEDCRYGVERKYSRDARLNLLYSVYRIPDLLRNNKSFPQDHVLKQKEGYTKLLRFMDDYWDVPVADRTITPELMHKLKTVPANYFPLIINRIYF